MHAHGPYLIIAFHLLIGQGVHAQCDSTGIGGPDATSPYEGSYGSSDPGSTVAWSAEDSARFIPGYAMYGDFDTDAIFERQERARKDSATLHIAFTSCDHQFPVCGAINSPFGPRRGRMHYGVDIDLEPNTPVMSAFEGMVRISRFHRQFGNVLVVRHPNGLETLYGHLNQRLVAPGDHVEAGDVIGLGGSTGRSTGAHLHFETRYLGQPIDPQLLFDVKEGELRASTLLVHPGLFTVVQRAKHTTPGSYRVRRGDTLYAIARRNGTTVKALCAANRISARSNLRVGQRLRLK